MGLLIAIARKVQLNSLRFEYEHKQIAISRVRSSLSNKISDYQMILADYDANSPEYKKFNQKIERLNQVEKRLNEQLTKIQNDLQMVEAEYRLCDQMIQSNIQRLYSGH